MEKFEMLSEKMGIWNERYPGVKGVEPYGRKCSPALNIRENSNRWGFNETIGFGYLELVES